MTNEPEEGRGWPTKEGGYLCWWRMGNGELGMPRLVEIDEDGCPFLCGIGEHDDLSKRWGTSPPFAWRRIFAEENWPQPPKFQIKLKDLEEGSSFIFQSWRYTKLSTTSVYGIQREFGRVVPCLKESFTLVFLSEDLTIEYSSPLTEQQGSTELGSPGLSFPTFRVESLLDWQAKKEADGWVAWYDTLKFTADGNSWEDLSETVGAVIADFFLARAKEGTLQKVFAKLGWEKEQKAFETFSKHIEQQMENWDNVMFDIPWRITLVEKQT